MIIFTLLDGREHTVPVADVVQERGSLLVAAKLIRRDAPDLGTWRDFGGAPLVSVKHWLYVPDDAEAAARDAEPSA